MYEFSGCGVLRDLHDELDALVAEAYGWPWPMEREEILERLVALHDERVEEERRGIVRWLRPEYQIPRFGKNTAPAPELALAAEASSEEAPVASESSPWPSTAVEQIAAVLARVTATPRTPEETAAGFRGARTELVRRHLKTLVLVGEVRSFSGSRYAAVAEPL
jgi:hypothetical protein